MGYITPVLFRNDTIHELVNDPEQLAKVVKEACVGNKSRSYAFRTLRKNPNRRWWQFWKARKIIGGILVNPIEGLEPMHADVSRVVLIHGNDWIDLSSLIYKKDWKVSVNHVKSSIQIAQKHLTELKRELKNRQ